MNEAALAELLAKQEITERLHQYCRAMDRIDDDLGRGVFHADAVADYGTMFQGTGYGFIDFVHESHIGMLVHAHHLSNILIKVDGDRAGSEAYVHVVLRSKGEGGTLMQITGHGRYIDAWEKRDGAWRIAHRRYIQAMDEVRAVGTTMYDTDGARDRTDPSYEVLGT